MEATQNLLKSQGIWLISKAFLKRHTFKSWQKLKEIVLATPANKWELHNLGTADVLAILATSWSDTALGRQPWQCRLTLKSPVLVKFRSWTYAHLVDKTYFPISVAETFINSIFPPSQQIMELVKYQAERKEYRCQINGSVDDCHQE